MSTKIFVSYSHSDKNDKKIFLKHLSPLKNNEEIEIWSDEEISAGDIFREEITNKLKESDIVCLMVSANYLSSDSCIKEKKLSFEIRQKKYIDIIPIIISDCGWKDDKDISALLALPTDGKSIHSYENTDNAWNIVYEKLKENVEKMENINYENLTDNNKLFLNNADLLANAHAERKTVELNDIFVYPNLTKIDEITDKEKIIDGDAITNEFYENKKILLVGENQSGKTALCKKIYVDLLENKFLPLYLKSLKVEGKIENVLKNIFDKQYKTQYLNYEKNKERIVLVIDDFHAILNKDKFMQKIADFKNQIIVVDDIFTFSLKEENLTKQYIKFRIKQYGPKKRDELIKKWISMNKEYDNKDNYKQIDLKTELVNNFFRKTMGHGGIPSYPFFILSLLNTFETANNKLKIEVTEQGYCYSALIYLYLRKEKVREEDIGAYLNFLSEIAIYFFNKDIKEVNQIEFDKFLELYKKDYNSYIDIKKILSNLHNSKIFLKSNLGNYFFEYDYFYYYFVAMNLSEHIDEKIQDIENMINNLHKIENAYILIFLLHHKKNDSIVEKILNMAKAIFKNITPTTLKKSELNIIDDNIIRHIAGAVLPKNLNPEKERNKRLDIQQNIEDNEITDEDSDNNLMLELRKGIKAIEVIGLIAKNRAGSLKKEKIKEMLRDAINVNLRIITLILKSIINQSGQEQVIEIISAKLKLLLRHKNEKNITEEHLKKMAEKIFWNLIFITIYGSVNNMIHSLGSDKLLNIISEIYEENKSPINCLLKHGIFMWYGKNLQVDVIEKELKDSEISETVKKIMRFLVVNHCVMHKISYKEKQKIETILKIPVNTLIAIEYKNK
jgi:hypothetical protein